MKKILQKKNLFSFSPQSYSTFFALAGQHVSRYLYTVMERLLEKEFQSSFPDGSVVGSVCKNPELMEDAWENAPMVSRSKSVT